MLIELSSDIIQMAVNTVDFDTVVITLLLPTFHKFEQDGNLHAEPGKYFH